MHLLKIIYMYSVAGNGCLWRNNLRLKGDIFCNQSCSNEAAGDTPTVIDACGLCLEDNLSNRHSDIPDIFNLFISVLCAFDMTSHCSVQTVN